MTVAEPVHARRAGGGCLSAALTYLSEECPQFGHSDAVMTSAELVFARTLPVDLYGAEEEESGEADEDEHQRLEDGCGALADLHAHAGIGAVEAVPGWAAREGKRIATEALACGHVPKPSSGEASGASIVIGTHTAALRLHKDLDAVAGGRDAFGRTLRAATRAGHMLLHLGGGAFGGGGAGVSVARHQQHVNGASARCRGDARVESTKKEGTITPLRRTLCFGHK